MQREGHDGGATQADILQLMAKRPLNCGPPSRAPQIRSETNVIARMARAIEVPAPMVARCEDN